MHRRRSVLGLLSTVPLAGTALLAAPAAGARPSTDPATIARHLEQFVADRAAQDLFSGTVLLAHHGQPILCRAFGLANQASGAANRGDTVFNLASVTKTFTGLAITQLVAAGRIAWQDSIAAHLDGFIGDAAAATVHQLLTHTSGVGRPALGGGGPTSYTSFADAMDGTLEVVKHTPVQFTPGSQFAYSNDGYWVLGAIVARVSGLPYDEYVRTRIFGPAGMKASGFLGLPDAVANPAVARPYLTQANRRVDFTTSPFAPYTNGPAGGAYASGPDMLRFARALRSGRLVEPAFADLTTAAKYPLAPADRTARIHSYAYGFEDDIVATSRIFGHSGSGPGAATQLDICTGDEWVLVVLSNYDTTIAPIVNYARSLITSTR